MRRAGYAVVSDRAARRERAALPRHCAALKSKVQISCYGVDAGELATASGTRASPFGLVRSSWAARATSGFAHNVTVPANAMARVLIPAKAAADVLEDGKPLPADVKVLGAQTVNRVPYVALGVGAGDYAFSSSWTRRAAGGCRGE